MWLDMLRQEVQGSVCFLLTVAEMMAASIQSQSATHDAHECWDMFGGNEADISSHNGPFRPTFLHHFSLFIVHIKGDPSTIIVSMIVLPYKLHETAVH